MQFNPKISLFLIRLCYMNDTYDIYNAYCFSPFGYQYTTITKYSALIRFLCYGMLANIHSIIHSLISHTLLHHSNACFVFFL